MMIGLILILFKCYIYCCMKEISKSYLSKKINKLNKKIHRAENQNDDNKVWWRKMKLEKLKYKLNKIN